MDLVFTVALLCNKVSNRGYYALPGLFPHYRKPRVLTSDSPMRMNPLRNFLGVTTIELNTSPRVSNRYLMCTVHVIIDGGTFTVITAEVFVSFEFVNITYM